MRWSPVLLLVAAQHAGCAGSSPQCARDEDCPSGFCRADRTCAPEDDAAPGEVDATPPDAASGCRPDHDGTIAFDELPLSPGRTATYRIALDAAIETAPTIDGQGDLRWDLSGPLAGDDDVDASLVAPGGQWWGDLFPGASYATPLSAESNLLGVFALDSTALQLLGVVSPTGGSARTELTYDPPVDVLVLPLAPGASWQVDSTVSGLAQGIIVAYTEAYESRVDGLGTIDTPYGEFPVSRVAVDLTRQVGASFVTRRTFSWVAECYASVATVVSQDYEDGAEFTDAAEVRRLAP